MLQADRLRQDQINGKSDYSFLSYRNSRCRLLPLDPDVYSYLVLSHSMLGWLQENFIEDTLAAVRAKI